MLGLLIPLCPPPAQQPPPPPPYQKLRYDEDYRVLQDASARTDFWDPVKFIPLSEEGDWYLSFGGEARLRYEYYSNYRWNPHPPDQDGYLLQRYLVHADLHTGEDVRFFAQFQASLEDWRQGGPRATDRDAADVHQLFTDIRFWHDDDDSITLRAGRQEMLYGSQRLISVRESPNIRRAFDAVRLLTRVDAWKVDAFFARPVEDDPGAFDDWGDDHTDFWGVYATRPIPFLPGTSVDLYYLGLRRPDATFVQGTGDELRHSLGSRIFGHISAWDYNVEGLVQLGSFDQTDILAWTLASDTGYTFKAAPTAPRLSLRADIISGDRDPRDNELNTFNPLFPRGAYFGESSIIGPANLIDLHPALELHATEKLKFSFDWDFFWRFSESDGLYDNGGNVLRRPLGSDARFIGHQPGISLEYELSRHTTINAVYSHFFADRFLHETGPASDIDFVGLWITYRF